MHKILFALLLAIPFSVSAQPSLSDKNVFEFRAVWVATVVNIDWPSKPGLSSQVQKAEFEALLDMHQKNGMNAVIMDNAVVGAGCVVGALCFVPTGMEIPPRKVVVGNPAKIVKDVTDDMLDWKTSGTQLYQQLPAAMRASWRVVEPLRAVPDDRPTQSSVLKNWKDTREGGTP